MIGCYRPTEIRPTAIEDRAPFQVFADGEWSPRGSFETLDEARGCVLFDHLTQYTIYDGEHIVEWR
jgi:hypothetical protein